MSDINNIIISCCKLSKYFIDNNSDTQSKTKQKSDKLNKSDKLEILKNINLQVKSGEQIAIIGSSGSGKTTLLNILAGLDFPSSGEVIIDNQNIFALSEKQQAKIRNSKLGFIYQFHHLLPELTALENVMLPILISGENPKQAKAKAQELLNNVQLKDRLHHKPSTLSGGEKQRVAVARALVMNPKCVLADEPTGNLDQHTAKNVMQLLQDLNKKYKTSLIIVTHDLSIANNMDHIYEMVAGDLIKKK
tara:strand:+ start:42 stop:785 length:744 start_codon:yes stop_codon:yes gene_type:complete